jgi:PAS domain S-box-containing protein
VCVTERISSIADRAAKIASPHKASLDTPFGAEAWLAAIVKDSDDAIVSKTLDSIILTWNAGAERLFGYTAEEAIGRPVTMLIPEDRLSEEDHILSRLRAGERVDHFETIRRHKDGTLIDVSLTISPVRDAAGEIIGASKIAHDITELKQSRTGQAIVLREMNHRIKNIFSLVGGLVALSARASTNDNELAPAILSRLDALARAHALTLPDLGSDDATQKLISFAELLRTIVAPHQLDEERVSISGEDVPLSGTPPHVDRAAPPRAHHQCRQIWRTIHTGWPDRSRDARRGRAVPSRLGGTRRPAGRRPAFERRLRQRTRGGSGAWAARHPNAHMGRSRTAPDPVLSRRAPYRLMSRIADLRTTRRIS